MIKAKILTELLVVASSASPELFGTDTFNYIITQDFAVNYLQDFEMKLLRSSIYHCNFLEIDQQIH